jgi:hypothetical protein
MYITGNPLRDVGGNKRGGVADVRAIRSFVRDIDVSKGPDYPADTTAALKIVESYPVAPSFVVSTGSGGLQAWWFLDETVILDVDTIPWARSLLARWEELCRLVEEELGYRLDIGLTKDLAHVWRIPGSLHSKAGRPVELLDAGTGEAVALETIEELLDARGIPSYIIRTDTAGNLTTSDAAVVLAQWIRGGPFMCPEMGCALVKWREALIDPAGRHPAMRNGQLALIRLGEQGHIGLSPAIAALHDTFMRITGGEVVREKDWKRALLGAVAKVEANPSDDQRRTGCGSGETGSDSMTAGQFWTTRGLDHYRQFAQARRVSPYALLGVVLARVVTRTPPHVVIPPSPTGSNVSLNLYLALVGRSGGGKNAADAVADEALNVGQCRVHGAGSGEGLLSLFLKAKPKTKNAGGFATPTDGEHWAICDEPAVFVNAGEISTLEALVTRQGATLLGFLKQMWLGEHAETMNAEAERRRRLKPHTYRLCLGVGVQPGRARALLDDADGGTPQRFLWLPTDDPERPKVRPPTPTMRTWSPPTETRNGDPGSPLRRMRIDEAIVAELDEARFVVLGGGRSELDGHAGLLRLKVACAFALLDGRIDVNEEDWALAGHLMDVSTATREAMITELAESNAARSRARGRHIGEQTLATAEVVDAAVRTKVAERIRRVLGRTAGGWLTGGELRRTISKAQRHALDDVVEALIGTGEIEGEGYERQGQSGVRYRLKLRP